MSDAVAIEGLTKVFKVGFVRKRTVLALDNLSLTIGTGETFGLLGSNGAGKTTTLKLLMGLLRPTAGGASILGEPISSTRMHRRIGYLPEQAYFYDYLTARELVAYYGRLADVDAKQLRKRVEEVLERVGLERAAYNRQLRKFSKGMLQRVGLAQAIVHDPEIVFLDEPMSGLDPVGRRQVRDLISELRDAGKTIVFSSHILSDVEALCDRVGILSKGRLVETGRLDEMLARRSSDLEIVVTNLAPDALEALAREGLDVSINPGGAHIRVADESEVEAALARVRVHGGRLISVNPTRSSLEDFFMREVATTEPEREYQANSRG